MMTLTDEILEALSDGLAVAGEFPAAPLHERLEAMGLPPDAVAEAVSQRWLEYRPPEPTEHELSLFSRAFAEGLIAGRMMRPEARA